MLEQEYPKISLVGFLKLIGYLHNAHYNLMRVSVFIKQIEFHHRIILMNVGLNVNDLVALQVLLYFFLQDKEGVCKIDFQGTGIVGGGFHLNQYQLMVLVPIVIGYRPTINK
jgi:hypothetical protein